ncbi:MAG: hypothetical protein ACR2FM_01295 [Candidatus Saccharimonadales bacterium]
MVRDRSRIKAVQAIKFKSVINEGQLAKLTKQEILTLKLGQSHCKLICALLFWCEGGKEVKSGMYFINSDPAMICMFLKLFRSSFDLDDRKFRIMLHIHSYHNEAQQILYWSNLTQIPANQFYKPFHKPHTGKNKKPGYQGCISVRYLNAHVAKQLKMTYVLFADKVHRGVR